MNNSKADKKARKAQEKMAKGKYQNGDKMHQELRWVNTFAEASPSV